MNHPPRILTLTSACLLALSSSISLPAQDTAPSSTKSGLFNFTKDFDPSSLITTQTVVSLVQDGDKTRLKIEFKDGDAQFPGVQFFKPGEIRDLSTFKGVQVEVTNVGTVPCKIGIRADNVGDVSIKPWNTAGDDFAPGETKILRIEFGKSWGTPSFALDPKQVSDIKLYGYTPPAGAVITISDFTGF